MQTLTTKQPLNLSSEKVREFATLVSAGIDAWVKAGEVLVEMVDGNPNAYSIILRECPHLSVDMLLAFEKIGRREIYPYLLLENCPGARMLAKLPFVLQNKYYKEPVEVLVGWMNGKPIVAKKEMRLMTKPEAERVFTANGVRSIEEQKALLPPPSRSSDPLPNQMGLGQIVNGKRALKRGDVQSLGQFTLGRSADGELILKKAETSDGFAIPLELNVNGHTSIFEVFVST